MPPVDLPEHRVAALEEIFGFFDSEGSGRMRVGDIGRALRCLGERLTESTAGELAQEADADGSGKITFNAFVLAVQRFQQRRERGPGAADVEDAVSAFVTDDEGGIEISQFRQILTSLAEPLTAEEADELIADASRPGDDFVPVAELLALLQGQQRFRY